MFVEVFRLFLNTISSTSPGTANNLGPAQKPQLMKDSAALQIDSNNISGNAASSNADGKLFWRQRTLARSPGT